MEKNGILRILNTDKIKIDSFLLIKKFTKLFLFLYLEFKTNYMKKIFPLFALLFLVSSCDMGTEIARLSIDEVSSEENIKEKSIELNLLKDEEISFWSEMDMKYEGEANLQFNVGLFLNDELYEAIAFDPREKNITVGEVKSDVNGKVKWKFSGKNKIYKVLEDGNYTIKAYFIASDNVTVNKSNLVIKK